MILPPPGKLYPMAVPGTRPVRVGGRVLRIVELRGWLRGVDATCYAKDPAWYYLLDPDPAWIDEAGMSMGDIFRVGNVTALGDRRVGTSAYRVVSRPLIRIEFGGWDPARRGPPPAGWSYQGAQGCPEVHFAFDPLRPVPSGPRLVPGSYVRVVGSLVSDVPHATKATVGGWLFRNLGLALEPRHRIYGTQSLWSDGGEMNANNPARWTEIHPPDQIEPLAGRTPSETVRGVALRAPRGSNWASAQPLTLTLSPPGGRPKWARGIRVAQSLLVLSRTADFERAVAATRLKTDRDRVLIRIDLGAAGIEAFAAIYRVSWSPEGNSWTIVKPRNLT